MNKKMLYVLAAIIAAAVLYASSLYNYPLFHSIVEMFTIVIAANIFVIAWNTRNYSPNPYLLFIGISYLYVASLDLIHTLGYKGMGVFAGSGANLSTQLWICGRYMQSISLLVAPYFIGRKLKIIPVFILYFLVSAGLLLSIYYDLFPATFIEGKGLTLFKIISEYVISLILVLAIIYLRKKRGSFDKLVLNLLIWSMATTIASEMAFTLYTDVYGFFNTIGHYFKIASFYLIYVAIIKTNLKKPYESMVIEIEEHKRTEEALAKSETRFRRLFESAKDGILILDAETGMILDANPFIAELLGYAHEELVGKAIWDLRFLKDRALSRDRFLELQHKGYLRYEDLPIRAANGQRIDVEFVSNVYMDGNVKVIQCNIRDITERKKLERKLIDSEARFRNLVETTSDWVWEVDKNGVYTYASPAVRYLLGYEPEDVLGKTPFDFMPTEEVKRVAEIFGSLVSERKHINYLENINLHKDGRQVILETCAVPFFDPSGIFMGYRGVDRDITERKKSEGFIKNILESIGEGFVVIGHDYRIITANRVYCEQNKMLLEDIIGRHCYEISHHTDKPCYEAGERCAPRYTFATGEPCTELHTHYDKEGTPVYVATKSYPMKDQGGRVISTIEIANDITERKKAEKALHEKTETIKTIIQTSPLAIITTDSQGYVTLWNQSAEVIFGWSADETIGKQNPIVPPDKLDEVRQVRQQILDGRSFVDFETERIRKDGTRITISFSATALQQGETKGILSIIADITERKKAEEERERLISELDINNRELEQILYAATHDLKTPLVNINGYTHELKNALEEITRVVDRKDISAETKQELSSLVKELPEMFSFISTSVIRMDTLLNGLLQFSRSGKVELKKEAIDMNMLIRGIADNLNYRLKDAGASLQVTDLPQCIGDREQISRIFSNLMENAVKYLEPSRKGKIKVTGHKDGNLSVYCVEDNGIGIAFEHQKQLFHIFHKLDPSKTGEGLGLAIVQRIVERHGGKVWLESEAGKGSKFYISLKSV